MLQFLKYTLASLFALLLFFGGLFFLFVGMVSLFEKDPFVVESNSMLVFDMGVNISDAPPSVDFGDFVEEAMGMGRARTHSLREVVDAIVAAAADDRITSLFLHGEFVPFEYGSGYAALLEVRQALEQFQAAGKPVVAYLKSPRIRDYYLASVADRVVVDPYGAVALGGMASQQVFFAEALEKLGVGVQIARAGDFKSAVEPFVRGDMSDENRVQTRELLDDLWAGIVGPVSDSRGFTVPELHELVDGRGWFTAREAVDAGLADQVGYFDEVQALMAETHGVSRFSDIPQADLKSYIASVSRPARRSARASQTLAIVYLEGNIVDGVGAMGEVGGDRFARELRRIREDDSIGAVVVRVNSPGGSAAASEVILREVSLLREEKPVVVSFGTVAASGGYWVATDADRVFAQPNTITGSIGVWGLVPNIERLSENIGIGWETVKTSPFADLMSITRPKTEEEMALIQGFVDQIYDDFLERVARGRGLDIEEVRVLAGGRVWSGGRALDLGLVDEIGGISQAIGAAAELGGLGARWQLYEFPAARGVSEILAEMFGDSPPVLESKLGNLPIWQELRTLQSLNDPRSTYARMPFNLHLE